MCIADNFRMELCSWQIGKIKITTGSNVANVAEGINERNSLEF